MSGDNVLPFKAPKPEQPMSQLCAQLETAANEAIRNSIPGKSTVLVQVYPEDLLRLIRIASR